MTFQCCDWLVWELPWAMPLKQLKLRQQSSLKATTSMGSPKLLRNMFYYNAKKSALEQIFLLMVIIGKARTAIWQINRTTLAKTVAANG